jgi:hypothetical protein
MAARFCKPGGRFPTRKSLCRLHRDSGRPPAAFRPLPIPATPLAPKARQRTTASHRGCVITRVEGRPGFQRSEIGRLVAHPFTAAISMGDAEDSGRRQAVGTAALLPSLAFVIEAHPRGSVAGSSWSELIRVGVVVVEGTSDCAVARAGARLAQSSSFGLWHASATSQVLASAVITRSGPARGRG